MNHTKTGTLWVPVFHILFKTYYFRNIIFCNEFNALFYNYHKLFLAKSSEFQNI